MAIQREIGTGAFLSDAEDMVVFLQSKFNEKRDSVYWVKEIDIKQLEEVQVQLKFYHIIKGSNEFQVIVFYPKNSNSQSS